MFSHVMVGSNDIERSKRFYDALLGVLGAGEPVRKRQKPVTPGCSIAMTADPSAYEPTKTSRSRIKRLRGMAGPQYRLRVEEVRVFYDVSGSTVEVLAIVPKPEAESWLARYGNPK